MKTEAEIKVLVEEKQKELQSIVDGQAAMTREFEERTAANQRAANACEGAIAALVLVLDEPA